MAVKPGGGQRRPKPAPHMPDSTKYFTELSNLTADYPDYEVTEDMAAAMGQVPLPTTVTLADINRSVPRDRRNCAYVIALERTTGADKAVVLNRIAYLIFHDRKLILRMRCPREVAEVIHAYDLTGQIKPGTYTFYPVEPSSQLGNGRKRKSGPHHTTLTPRTITRMNLSYRRWDPSNTTQYGTAG